MDSIERAKEIRKTWKGTNKEFVDKVGIPARAAHDKKTKALESKKQRHARYKKEDKFTAGMHEMNSRNHIQIDN